MFEFNHLNHSIREQSAPPRAAHYTHAESAVKPIFTKDLTNITRRLFHHRLA